MGMQMEVGKFRHEGGSPFYVESVVDKEVYRFRPARLKQLPLDAYFRASAPTMLWKIFKPSDDPSISSLERSGCGIIPSTFRPSLQMPAMLSSDPLGFAAGVTSP